MSRFAEVNHEAAPDLYRRAAPWLHRLLTGAAKRDWDGFPSLPQTGPAIVVANHLSSFDAVLVADYILYHGRFPYFLAKASLWNVPLLGRFLRGIGQIPVVRGTHKASEALVEASHKLDEGKVVFIFPEGTTSRDPQMWPFAVKTGAARLAIETGMPIIPVGHWGSSTICPDNEGPQRVPHPWPRPWVRFRSGEPIDLSAFGHDPDDREAVRGACAAIIEAIVPLVEQARGDVAPAERWNPKTKSYVPPAEAIW